MNLVIIVRFYCIWPFLLIENERSMVFKLLINNAIFISLYVPIYFAIQAVDFHIKQKIFFTNILSKLKEGILLIQSKENSIIFANDAVKDILGFNEDLGEEDPLIESRFEEKLFYKFDLVSVMNRS